MSVTDLYEFIKTFSDYGPKVNGTETAEFSTLTWVIYDKIFTISVCVGLIIIVSLVISYIRSKRKDAVKESPSTPRTRFRKRDKVLFYGRKMLRQVRSFSQTTGKKRKMISKFTKKFLQLKKDHSPGSQLQVLEPPAEYLQEDLSNIADHWLPPEVAYMLQSIRVFGVFERPLFLQLCRHMETVHIAQGQFLFRIGESDDNFYVVQSGKLNVFITEADGSTISLKIVKEGDSVASLLSFCDVLTGHPHPFKTVSAQAIQDSKVLKLPVAAFQEVFEQYPETFVRVVQIIMTRLHRVTFTALHQHLGLSAEIMTAPRRKSVAFNISPLKRGGSGPGAPDEASRTPDLLDSDASYSHDGGLVGSGQTMGVGQVRKRVSAPITVTASASAPILRSSGGSFSSLQQAIDSGLNLLSEDTEGALRVACEAFRVSLGLDENVDISDLVHVRDYPAGAYFAKEDSQQDTGLAFNISGLLAVTQKDGDRDILMYHAYPGEFVGALSVLTGEPSIFSIRAKQYTRVAVMPTSSFYTLMSSNPKVVLHIAHIIVQRLSPFVRQIDFAMDWSFVESGRALYRQGDESDCTYIILSGRLRSVITRQDGKKQLVGEYSRGDLVGVVETLTVTPRSTTVMAVRDTEIAKLPEGLLNAIKLKYPIVVTRLINLLGHRILGSWQQSAPISSPPAAAFDSKPSHVNFCTVAVMGTSDDVPLTSFTFELIHSLSAIGTCLRLNSEYIKKILGPSILDTPNEYKLTSWLAQQEDKHRIVLYQCDHNMSVWTQRCIRQADCILIVGLGDGEPKVSKMEKQIEHLSIRTEKELILLHKEGGSKPQRTAHWLNARSWCSSHHHLQCPKRMFSKKAIRNTDYYAQLLRTEPNVHSDFSRLARWLTGTSVGLILGGGGARGAAHVGMIKAIQEAGIPIDMIGGVSIGSLMGALWCSERNITIVTQKAREWAKKMTQWWRQALDLTWPATSMFSGAGFNQTIIDTLDDAQIEDLWLPYFAVTTDITSSCMRIHTHGSLWRYVRASMSLSGYMPPLCDPADGHLLLDGGYVNNLPADVMRNRGARYILAVDVGSQDDTDLTNYGDSLSGWWLLWQKWTSAFRSTAVKVPSLPDIQSRLAYVSCVRQLEEVRNSDYCHYVRPPIDKYKTLQFGSFDEIKDVGYQHGKTYFDGMMKGSAIVPNAPQMGMGLLGAVIPKARQHSRNSSISRSFEKGNNVMPYNFTDLAQMVCKVRRDPLGYNLGGTDDDYSDDDTDCQDGGGYASEPGYGNQKDEEEREARMQTPRLKKSVSLSENDMESEAEYGTP